jgi:hypothetical protein
LATIAGFGCLYVSDHVLQTKPGSLVTEAHAVIGRPLTPLSYAGVARRTTRRAYGAYGAYGAYAPYGAVVAAPVVVAPACMQVVNVYGQLQTVCQQGGQHGHCWRHLLLQIVRLIHAMGAAAAAAAFSMKASLIEAMSPCDVVDGARSRQRRAIG